MATWHAEIVETTDTAKENTEKKADDLLAGHFYGECSTAHSTGAIIRADNQ